MNRRIEWPALILALLLLCFAIANAFASESYEHQGVKVTKHEDAEIYIVEKPMKFETGETGKKTTYDGVEWEAKWEESQK